MLKAEIIGNLGADAEVKVAGENEFTTFRMAHSDKRTDRVSGEVIKQTTWVNVTRQGNSQNLLPFLKKGIKVYVRGNLQMKTTQDPAGRVYTGLYIHATEIELCGQEPRAELSTTNNPNDNTPF